MTLEDARSYVLTFFNGDREKATLWWNTENPQLGGIRPNDMILLHREQKLLQWIENQRDGFHE